MSITVKKSEVMRNCNCFQIENTLEAQYLKVLFEYTIEPFFHTVSRGQHSATVVFFSDKALTWGAASFGKPIPKDILAKYEKKATKMYKTIYRHKSASIRKLYEKMLKETIAK